MIKQVNIVEALKDKVNGVKKEKKNVGPGTKAGAVILRKDAVYGRKYYVKLTDTCVNHSASFLIQNKVNYVFYNCLVVSLFNFWAGSCDLIKYCSSFSNWNASRIGIFDTFLIRKKIEERKKIHDRVQDILL